MRLGPHPSPPIAYVGFQLDRTGSAWTKACGHLSIVVLQDLTLAPCMGYLAEAFFPAGTLNFEP